MKKKLPRDINIQEDEYIKKILNDIKQGKMSLEEAVSAFPEPTSCPSNEEESE